ncbi:hypothetical protein Slin15195_G114960 [Septoria linicola]|uniref:Uncharacterized protein n=1 Tax=Septoria linicola TaxID=215465 RepID=A0A9Q9AY81_9PEZI|nr:hypothetical protein Slin15195_G114960 [Septoria linicola]
MANHPTWEVFVDGSVRPYHSILNPGKDGGFAGCAWVTLNPITGDKRFAMGYTMPSTRDVTSTELKGILEAFQYLDKMIQLDPGRDFICINVTVYSDYMDAIDEVRYAFAPADGPIPLSGHRVGFTESFAHPDLSYGILKVIRSLEARGIVARLMWMARRSTPGACLADDYARRVVEYRRRFVGSGNVPAEFIVR